MTKPEEVLAAALALSSQDRGHLADQLISSLDGEADPAAEHAWQEEIQRRLGEIDRGEVVCVPWEEVRERLRLRVAGELIRERVRPVVAEQVLRPHVPLFASADPTLAERVDELLAGFGER